jgi:hypothetical protein
VSCPNPAKGVTPQLRRSTWRHPSVATLLRVALRRSLLWHRVAVGLVLHRDSPHAGCTRLLQADLLLDQVLGVLNLLRPTRQGDVASRLPGRRLVVFLHLQMRALRASRAPPRVRATQWTEHTVQRPLQRVARGLVGL